MLSQVYSPAVGSIVWTRNYVACVCRGAIESEMDAAEGSGCDRCVVTEKLALLDDLHYFRRNHPFPGAISRLQFGQCVGRINSQVLWMIIGDLFDVSIVD